MHLLTFVVAALIAVFATADRRWDYNEYGYDWYPTTTTPRYHYPTTSRYHHHYPTTTQKPHYDNSFCRRYPYDRRCRHDDDYKPKPWKNDRWDKDDDELWSDREFDRQLFDELRRIEQNDKHRRIIDPVSTDKAAREKNFKPSKTPNLRQPDDDGLILQKTPNAPLFDDDENDRRREFDRDDRRDGGKGSTDARIELPKLPPKQKPSEEIVFIPIEKEEKEDNFDRRAGGRRVQPKPSSESSDGRRGLIVPDDLPKQRIPDDDSKPVTRPSPRQERPDINDRRLPETRDDEIPTTFDQNEPSEQQQQGGRVFQSVPPPSLRDETQNRRPINEDRQIVDVEDQPSSADDRDRVFQPLPDDA